MVPVVVFTLFAGFVVICLIFVTKLVKSVAKDTKADIEDIPKSKIIQIREIFPFSPVCLHSMFFNFFLIRLRQRNGREEAS